MFKKAFIASALIAAVANAQIATLQPTIVSPPQPPQPAGVPDLSSTAPRPIPTSQPPLTSGSPQISILLIEPIQPSLQNTFPIIAQQQCGSPNAQLGGFEVCTVSLTGDHQQLQQFCIQSDQFSCPSLSAQKQPTTPVAIAPVVNGVATQPDQNTQYVVQGGIELGVVCAKEQHNLCETPNNGILCYDDELIACTTDGKLFDLVQGVFITLSPLPGTGPGEIPSPEDILNLSPFGESTDTVPSPGQPPQVPPPTSQPLTQPQIQPLVQPTSFNQPQIQPLVQPTSFNQPQVDPQPRILPAPLTSPQIQPQVQPIDGIQFTSQPNPIAITEPAFINQQPPAPGLINANGVQIDPFVSVGSFNTNINGVSTGVNVVNGIPTSVNGAQPLQPSLPPSAIITTSQPIV
jgi:hypothetical protein